MTPLEHMARVLQIGTQLMDDSIARRVDPFWRQACEHAIAQSEREAREDAAENLSLKQEWDALREKMAARMNLKLPSGMRGRGTALAYLEDADHSIAGFLSETGA